MINLIPPSAKKSIKIEYWVRVLSVWLLIWSLVLVASVGILWPTYTLINSQVGIYEQSANDVSKQVSDYKVISKELIRSSQQAKLIINESNKNTFSEYISLFESLQSEGIELSKIELSVKEGEFAPVNIIGTASDRRTLAGYRDRLLESDKIDTVDLPISNLAQDKEIKFSITVNIVKKIDV
ncbi:hypothetical protein H6784_03555 [Candidatus Nomurabacteria bacterium]|nr:hypothetical protein [Candidatus Nomurabacteria bacterium]